MSYLILCKQLAMGKALWWRCDRAGYTVDIAQAGRYSKEEAESIARIRGEDFPVEESEIGKRLTPRMIVDVEDGENYAELCVLRGLPDPRRADETSAHPGFQKLTDAVIAEMRWTCAHGNVHERWIATAACGCDRPALSEEASAP